MGLLDAIRTQVDRTISAMADSSLQYRATDSGSWSAFPGGVLNTDTPVAIGYDEDEGGEVQMQTGTLVAQFTSPVLDVDYQVQDVHGQGWAVLGVDRSVAAVTYRLRREALADAAYGSNRGGRER